VRLARVAQACLQGLDKKAEGWSWAPVKLAKVALAGLQGLDRRAERQNLQREVLESIQRLKKRL
jgi:hypothetical protein